MVKHNFVILVFVATWALGGRFRQTLRDTHATRLRHARLATSGGCRLALGVNSFHDDRDGEGVRARHAIIVFHSACTLTDRAPPRLAAFGQNIPYHFILSKSLSLCSRGRRWWQAQLVSSHVHNGVDVAFLGPLRSEHRLTFPDDDFSFLNEAEDEIDALVSDDTFDRYMQNASGVMAPPGFESSTGSPASRHAHPSPALARVPPGLSSGIVTPEQTKRRPITPASSDAKKHLKAYAAEVGLSRTTPSHAHPEPAQGALQDEDFPALGQQTQEKGQPATPAASTPSGTPVAKKAKLASKAAERAERAAERAAEKASKKEAREAEKAAKKAAREAEKAAKEEEKKKAAEKAAAEQKAAEEEAAAKAAEAAKTRAQASQRSSITIDTNVTASPSKESSAAPEKSGAFPPLPTATAMSPQAPKAAPKTLRLVSTPKPEVAPVGSPVSAISRAMSTSNTRPGTPPSEMMSETASMVSNSVSASRAGSPPPSGSSIIGSAHTRAATKSQQRKQRKDQTKQETKVLAETLKEIQPEEHAPIMGRKKKQKKEKPAKPKPEPEKKAKEIQEQSKADESNKPEEPQQKPQHEDGHDHDHDAEPEAEEPEPKLEKSPNKKEPKDIAEPEYGPSQVFAEISQSLSTAVENLNLLNPVAFNTRIDKKANPKAATEALVQHIPESYKDCKDSTCKCAEILEADLVALRAGKPVRKQFHVDGSRMLITPNGDCIRGLTEEEEDKFLELQKSIASEAEHPGSFVFQRHQPGNGAFSLIKGRAVPNGRPNIFPATSQPQGQDPIGKLQREDALSYINQYVLPRLNLGATNVGWPKGATVRQDAAAASLNSLAPYFYGPDAAAGVGIYSAPDSKDFAAANPALTGAPGADGVANWSAGMGATPAVSGMPLMSVEDAEAALSAAKKETEKLQKRLNGLIQSNRRILLNGN